MLPASSTISGGVFAPASAFGAVNIYGNKAKMIGLLPEYRYWFNGRPMTREFVGIAALGVSYDITWGDRIYQGDAAGAESRDVDTAPFVHNEFAADVGSHGGKHQAVGLYCQLLGVQGRETAK